MILQGSLFLLVMGIGLQSRWSDLTYALTKPRMLLRGFVAVNIVVPVAAVLLCLIFPVDRLTRVGLIIMSVSPLAPFAPLKMIKTGAQKSAVIGFYVALVAASVVVVPATVAIMNWFVASEVSLPVMSIGWFVLQTILVPITIGMAVGSQWPDFGRRAARVATLAAYIVLLPLAILILVKMGGAMFQLLGDGTLAVIVLTVLAGLAAGHWLGGDVPENRIARAQAAATRHPGIAALIAQRNFGDQQVIAAILLFLIVGMVIDVIYINWARRRLLGPSGRDAARILQEDGGMGTAPAHHR